MMVEEMPEITWRVGRQWYPVILPKGISGFPSVPLGQLKLGHGLVSFGL